MKKHFLVFGASGLIGAECHSTLQSHGTVLKGEREVSGFQDQLSDIPQLDAVIWAQGINSSDSIADYEEVGLRETLDANVLFILRTAKLLLNSSKLRHGSQLVVISSIWAQYSRPEKLSYSTSKAATSAIIRSLAVDLGPLGIQVNAISPGPIDSPMTRKNLTTSQIDRITSETPLKRLVSVEEVTQVAVRFAIGEMSGITGQDILVDAGWGVSKLV